MFEDVIQEKESKIVIKPEHYYYMWFEDEKGNKIECDCSEPYGPWPSVEEYPFACVRNLLEVRTSMYNRRSDGLYGGTDLISVYNQSAPESLVLALALGANNQKKYNLSDAIAIAGNCCEGCMNVLADRYGLDWGYKEGSEEHLRCGTRCNICNGAYARVIGEKEAIATLVCEDNSFCEKTSPSPACGEA